MRLGLMLHGDALVDEARSAERHGFDLVWLAPDRGVPDPIGAAAFLAPATSSVLVAAQVSVGEHPVVIAERAAVCDLLLGGRLVVALSVEAGRPDAGERLAETAAIIRLAHRARPFRFDGHHWQVPGDLPGNEDRPTMVRVTPTPAQLCVPLLGVDGAPRYEVVGLDVSFDVAQVAADLLVARDGRDVEIAVFDPQGTSRERRSAMVAVTRRLRPRVQMEGLPPGLAEYWDRQWERGEP